MVEVHRLHDVRQWRSLLCSAQAARDLVPSTRLVLLVLADGMNADGSGGYPRLERKVDEDGHPVGPEGRSLVERTGLKRRMVLEHLATAERLGYLLQTAKGAPGRNATYVPAQPNGCSRAHLSTSPADENGCAPAHGQVRYSAQTGAPECTPLRSTPTATPGEHNPPQPPPQAEGAPECRKHLDKPGRNCRQCKTSQREVNGIKPKVVEDIFEGARLRAIEEERRLALEAPSIEAPHVLVDTRPLPGVNA